VFLLPEGSDLEPVLQFGSCVIQGDILCKYVWYSWFLKNSLPWVFPLASPAVDALIRMDIKLARELVPVLPNVLIDAIDRTYSDTSGIEAVAVKASYHPWHRASLALSVTSNLFVLCSAIETGFQRQVSYVAGRSSYRGNDLSLPYRRPTNALRPMRAIFTSYRAFERAQSKKPEPGHFKGTVAEGHVAKLLSDVPKPGAGVDMAVAAAK